MASSSRESLTNWLKTIEIDCDSVLDIGGSVDSIRERLKSFHCNEYKILDNCNEKYNHDKWTEPDIVWDINKKMSKQNHIYDVIFMIEVSEYLYDPMTVFRNINRLLKKGGCVYFSTHFTYPLHQPVDNDYLRFTEQGISKILSLNHFIYWESKPRLARSTDLINWYASEGMRMAKGQDHRITGHLWKGVK